MNPTIEINNVGPVTEFECEVPPGVTVIGGRHGAGKTTILRTVQLATDGRADRKPTKSDGTPRGSAKVAGKTLSITKVVREEGELTVAGLGDLSLETLHTPRFDSAVVRDRHRIATLVRLAGVAASPTMFHRIIGDAKTFDSFVDADALKTDDLVEMSARIKRRLEKHALEAEGKASTAEQRYAAEIAAIGEIDLSQPDDADTLTRAMRDAIAAQATINEQRAAADRAAEAASDARARLGALPPAADVEAMNAAEIEACRASDEAEEARRAAWEAFQAAERKRVDAARAVEDATRARESAEREQAIRSELSRTIESALAVDRPSEAAITSAETAVQAAQRAVETGVRVREAKAAKQRASKFAGDAKTQAQLADLLRKAAAETRDVLSDAIASIPHCPLKVECDDDGEPRLVMATARSDAELFDERSDGERWQTVLDIAAASDTLIVLSQAGWGELSGRTRGEIHRMAVERGCRILTAQADDGELRAKWMGAVEGQPAEAVAA